ncbi:hypothetical protein B9479_003469 [Cryptococcus floricola]|uniref:RING-type E3 ubiquitin transferase n=1 Tax=Cryptococcus floricola TaxID=2591691 RepID=A0A5D3AWM4_9TREE|nr:hypothetical protein B9479_003469 [Cryptococcus floricola]
MPRNIAVEDNLYLDEAEEFILEHAVVASPPRSWRPKPTPSNPPTTSTAPLERTTTTRRKMDWTEQVKAHPDEPLDESYWKKGKRRASGVADDYEVGDEEGGADQERCIICLMGLNDRTIVGVCGHEFCFECICIWSNQSRKCPLCSGDMAPFLLHDLDAETPTKYYLPPLPSKSAQETIRDRLPTRQERARSGEPIVPDEVDLQVARRRQYYQHELYAKHMGTNRHSRFRPNPTPRQISEDPQLAQRAQAFIRRELRIWPALDVEYLTTYILSLLKAIDARSEAIVRLLSEFLDTDEFPSAAEHFAHEVYSFLRSPFRFLSEYDEIAQYDPIPQSPSPRGRSPLPKALSPRGRSHSRSFDSLSSRSYSRSRSPSPYSDYSRSRSYSPRPRQRSPYPRSRSPYDRYRSPPPYHRRPLSPRRGGYGDRDPYVNPGWTAQLEARERKREKNILKRRRREERRAEHARVRQVVPPNGWGQAEQGMKDRVELLPSPPKVQRPLDEDVEMTSSAPSLFSRLAPASRDMQRQAPPHLASRLSIKGAAAARQGPPLGKVSINEEIESRRLSLKERLDKAKADAEAKKSAATEGADAVPAVKLSLKERLERAKAEGAKRYTGIPSSTPPPTSLPNEAGPPSAPSVPPKPVRTNSQGDTKQGRRGKLQLRLKLEHERALMRASAQAPPAATPTPSITQPTSQPSQSPLPPTPAEGANQGVEATMEKALKRMTEQERQREVRRRLMVAKLKAAETDQERRARELKVRLMERKKGVEAGVVV